MTLVMYIPYKDGSLLIADRQNTFFKIEGNGVCKKEVKKLCLVSDEGPAIGSAGDTEIYTTLYERITTRNDIKNDNVIGKLRELLREVSGHLGETRGPYRVLDNIEMIIVAYEDGEIVPYRLHGLAERRIDRMRCEGIGGGERATGPLLNVSTTSLSEKGAIGWGVEIIRQVAFENYAVGAPEYHGLDVITISNDGRFSETSKSPSIKRLVDIPGKLKELAQIEIKEEEA